MASGTGDTEHDIDLVLITGAGASTAFGVNGGRLPMMREWSDLLVHKLAGAGTAYLELVGLTSGLEPEVFERTLGEFLRQAYAFDEIGQLVTSSAQLVAIPEALRRSQMLDQWYRQTSHDVHEIIKHLRSSLYEEFGFNRLAIGAATAAYGQLLQKFGITGDSSLVYATTNYDSLGKRALGELDRLPDTGEHMLPPGAANSGRLRVAGLLGGLPRSTPVLHLHGAVGWYRDEGRGAYVVGDNATYNEGFGVPIIMLPDPEKDYYRDDVISELWEQFHEALSRARRVLVLGHSLNDPQLVAALREYVVPPSRLGIGGLADPGRDNEFLGDAEPFVAKVRRELPGAIAIPVIFQDPLLIRHKQLDAWLRGS